MIERLAMLYPTGKKEPENVLDQRYWDTHSSQPQGEEFRRERAMFLADLACLGDSAPYIARGLLLNLRLSKGRTELLDASGLKLFTDRLLKGKSDPATCPGVRGFTDTDWADLSLVHVRADTAFILTRSLRQRRKAYPTCSYPGF